MDRVHRLCQTRPVQVSDWAGTGERGETLLNLSRMCLCRSGGGGLNKGRGGQGKREEAGSDKPRAGERVGVK